MQDAEEQVAQGYAPKRHRESTVRACLPKKNLGVWGSVGVDLVCARGKGNLGVCDSVLATTEYIVGVPAVKKSLARGKVAKSDGGAIVFAPW